MTNASMLQDDTKYEIYPEVMLNQAPTPTEAEYKLWSYFSSVAFLEKEEVLLMRPSEMLNGVSIEESKMHQALENMIQRGNIKPVYDNRLI